jgi:hypothetical protein
MKTKPTKPTECERCIEAYKKGLLIWIERELKQTIRKDLEMSDEYLLTLEVFKRLKEHIKKTLR